MNPFAGWKFEKKSKQLKLNESALEMQRFSSKNSGGGDKKYICSKNTSSDGRITLNCVASEPSLVQKAHSRSENPSTVKTKIEGGYSVRPDIRNLESILDSVAGSDYSRAASILNHHMRAMHKQPDERCVKSENRRFKAEAMRNADDNDLNDGDFDYIVVGSGPAGCVLANRLVKGGKKVLLLEAGDDNSAEAKIRVTGNPAQQIVSDFPEYYWQGNTIDQLQSQGIMNQWSNGRLLGGGTSINGYQVVSSMGGGAGYWTDLASSLGDNRWNAANMQARMKNLETLTAYGFTPDNTRGTTGEWTTVTRPVYANASGPGSDDYKLAAMYSGYFGVPVVNDYNTSASPASCAFARWQLNQIPTENMDRESSDTAFINDLIDSNGKGIGVAKNKLRVVVNATVIKLLFTPPHGNTCNGVAYTRNGNYRECYAKEVILCTNLNTTQILQVNGIGPASVLNDAGVAIRQANEFVGRRLSNHLLIQLWFLDVSGNLTGLKDPNEPVGSIYSGGAFQEYPSYVQAGRRAIQWIFLTFPAGPGTTLVIAVPVILLPAAEGSIKIQNPDPLKIVLADTNYYNDNNGTNTFPPLPAGNSSVNNEANSIDLALMREASRDIKDMFVSHGLIPFGDIVPGQNVSTAEYADDNLLNLKFKLQNVQPHHWQGEVRMGTSPSNGAVDSTGKVFGIKGLRVAGAPILPPNPGNLATPALLTGQVIAEAILAGQ